MSPLPGKKIQRSPLGSGEVVRRNVNHNTSGIEVKSNHAKNITYQDAVSLVIRAHCLPNGGQLLLRRLPHLLLSPTQMQPSFCICLRDVCCSPLHPHQVNQSRPASKYAKQMQSAGQPVAIDSNWYPPSSRGCLNVWTNRMCMPVKRRSIASCAQNISTSSSRLASLVNGTLEIVPR